MSELYIGLMSGTSADGIDVALADCSSTKPKLIATHYAPYTRAMRTQIQALWQPGDNEIYRLATLDVALGKAFAEAALALLKVQSLSPRHIEAIGSHGQSIRHFPDQPHCFTLQIGDPNVIATQTGITTVADFRRKDVALGGQGAPLIPMFHQLLFAKPNHQRAVVNIGGIANITLLSPDLPHQLIAFDTGPGNTLLDAWIAAHQSLSHDMHGAWARAGILHHELLEQCLSDPYFQRLPPKSTGFEYFNLGWLDAQLKQIENGESIEPIDIQRTLTELTAISIVNAVHQHFRSGEILLCGGGAHNQFLVERISVLSAPFTVATTEAYGMHPDWIEAVGFAWFAKQTLNRKPINLPHVTGAQQSVPLGGIWY
jgi:anhydro-N-acetylmuramic acid kinase